MKTDMKIVVLLHGYPTQVSKRSPLYQYFLNSGYTIIAPYLFSPSFPYTVPSLTRIVRHELHGMAPDVIVGVSIGGMIAPHIARLYPQAKLVLVGTGPYLKMHNLILDTAVLIANKKAWTMAHKIFARTPRRIYAAIYKAYYRVLFKRREDKKKLSEIITNNWMSIRNISLEKDLEIRKCLTTINNARMLRSLTNKTIVFTGSGDVMMPTVLSQKLHQLIRGSVLVSMDKKLHFELFTKENYLHLDHFLHEK